MAAKKNAKKKAGARKKTASKKSGRGVVKTPGHGTKQGGRGGPAEAEEEESEEEGASSSAENGCSENRLRSGCDGGAA